MDWGYNYPMIFFLLLFAVAVPFVLWLFFAKWWDRKQPEPMGMLVRLFVDGIFAAALIGTILVVAQVILSSTAGAPAFEELADFGNYYWAIFAGFIIALAHEITKLVIAFYSTKSDSRFDQRSDGIIYLVSIALGAALAENVVYAVGFAVDGDLSKAAVGSFLFGALFVPVMVSVSSGLAGVGLGLLVLREDGTRPLSGRLAFAAYLFAAVFTHWLFRFLLFTDQRLLAGLTVLIAMIYLLSRFSIDYFTKVMRR